LIKHDIIKEHQKVQVSKLFNLYFFEIHGIPSVLFDKFFLKSFWGITDYDRKITIPKLILGKYGKI
jgi:hypothetical protein